MTDKPKDDTSVDEPESPAKPTTSETDWKAEAEKFKALARKHELRAKDNAKAAERLKDLEDADKTELEKMQGKLTEAEQRATAAELRAMRFEIAAEKGLTPAQAKRLVGDTKEEIEADAAELIEVLGVSTDGTKRPPARKPTERLQPGGPDPETEPDDADAAFGRLLRGEAV